MWWVIIGPDEARKLVAEVLGEDYGDLYMAGVILLTAFCIQSRNPNKIAAWLGYSRAFVRQICRRYREGGMWPQPGVSHAEWEVGDVVFVADCMVGIGQVKRTVDQDGCASYWIDNGYH